MMMKYALTVMSIALVLSTGACRNEDTETPAADATAATVGDGPSASATSGAELTPERLGELGAKIRKEPARADELLTEHGLTRESFEAAIRKVTENPEESKRYAEAYRKGA